jgi:hypothetical protein
MTEII